MKIRRVEKQFEVIEGVKSYGIFDTMEEAVQYINEFGKFSECDDNKKRNLGRRDKNYESNMRESVDIEPQVLKELENEKVYDYLFDGFKFKF